MVGVDPDSCRIAVAKQQLTQASSTIDTSVSFLEDSVHEARPFGQFDAIYSNYVFHWFERAERGDLLKCMYDSLKPGGRLAFLLEPEQEQQHFLLRDADCLAMPDMDAESATGLKLDSPSVWLQHCTDAGFTVETSHVEQVENVDPSLESHLRILEAAVPGFKCVMLEQNQMEILKNRYKSGNSEEIRHSFTILKVLARKQ